MFYIQILQNAKEKKSYWREEELKNTPALSDDFRIAQGYRMVLTNSSLLSAKRSLWLHWLPQLRRKTGQATSDTFLWRLLWVCPCKLQSFSDTHAGRSKNGWRKEGTARHHCSSLFLPLPSLQGSIWSGLSGGREKPEGLGDEIEPFVPILETRTKTHLFLLCMAYYLTSVCGLFYRVTRSLGDTGHVCWQEGFWRFQVWYAVFVPKNWELVIFKVVLLNTIFRNKK